MNQVMCPMVTSSLKPGLKEREKKESFEFLRFRRRDSAPIQNHASLSLTPDPSSSLNSINLTTSSNDQLDAPPIVYRPSSDISLVDEHRLQAAKETEIVEVDSDLEDDEDDEIEDEESDGSQENTYENTNRSNNHHPKPNQRTVYDVLPSSPPMPQSTTDHCQSRSSTSSSSRLTSTNEQQIIDIDTALREVLSGIRTVEECHAQCFRSMSSNNTNVPHLSTQQESDAPDLVLNLPISSGLVTPPATKSIDNNLNDHQSSSSNSSPIHHSSIANNSTNNNSLIQTNIINESARTSRSNSSSTAAPPVHFIEKIRPSPEPNNRKKIPPPIMKKPEKTVELLKRLGLQPSNDSSCGATSSSSSSSSTSSSHLHPQAIPVAGSSKTTDV